ELSYSVAETNPLISNQAENGISNSTSHATITPTTKHSTEVKIVALLPTTRPLEINPTFDFSLPINQEEKLQLEEELDQLARSKSAVNGPLTLHGSVLGEVSLFFGGPSEYTPIVSGQTQLQLSINTSNNWHVGVGARLGRYVWRSELNSNEPTNLYRPGTIDTIFRNTVDGTERIVTTDSIPGVVNIQFRGYGKVTTLDLPITLGKNWPLLGGQFGAYLGVAPTFVLERRGNTVVEHEEIAPVAESGFFDPPFYLQLVGRLRYAYSLSKRLSIYSSIELGHSTSPLITNNNKDYRLTRYQGGLGISFQF
ncbi:MAG: hypothetical protein AAFQ37_03525, partial [Bacteroidota bacterium]